MINWKVRFKNPVFIAQLVMAFLMPVLTYMGIKVSDLTTWAKVGEVLLMAIQNPYVLGSIALSLWNAINDPTTKGLKDSKQAMTYNEPKAE